MNELGNRISSAPLPNDDHEALLPSLLRDATFAFQPIVDANERSIFGYEALVRGRNNEPAAEVLTAAGGSELGGFERQCVTRIVGLAARLYLSSVLSINLPATADAAELVGRAARVADGEGISTRRLMFEVGVGKEPADLLRMRDAFEACRRAGSTVAIDKFGGEDAGLDLLAEFRPDVIKLSIDLVRDVNLYTVHKSVVTGITQLCRELGILVIAVGVETAEECRALRDGGVHLFQGHCFARPRFEGLPPIPATVWARIDRRTRLDRRAQGSSRPDRRKPA